MKESLQLASVERNVVEIKRRGNETSIGITGGFDGKALELKLSNRKR